MSPPRHPVAPQHRQQEAGTTAVASVNAICVYAPVPCYTRLATRNWLGFGSSLRLSQHDPPHWAARHAIDAGQQLGPARQVR
jgi:hypothetical protein